MGRSVHIKTPIPSLEEVGESLGISKTRQQRLIDIVRSKRDGNSGSQNGRGLDLDGRVQSKKGDAKTSARRKKSRRATSR